MAKVSVTDKTRMQGKRLRALRQQRGISKGKLLDALGFGSTQTYDLYERGTSVIRLDRLEDWAAAFNMSPLAFTANLLYDAVDHDLFARASQVAGPKHPILAQSIYDTLKDADERTRDAVLAIFATVLPSENES